MDENLSILLKTLGIAEKDYHNFEFCRLEKPVYNKNNPKFNFDIYVSKPLDINGYKILLKNIDKFPYPADITYHYEDESVLTPEVLDGYFKFICGKHFPAIAKSEDLHYHFEGLKLLFDVKSDLQEELLRNLEKDLVKQFDHLGISLKVFVNVIKDEALEKKVKEDTDGLNSALVKQAVDEENKKEKRLESAYSKKPVAKYDAVEAKIADLTSNDKNIYVIGKITRAEAKELRNKRLMLTFDITDFHDSISGKVYENARFDREAINNVKVGDYVKVIGSVEYDSYDKEDIISTRAIEKLDIQDEVRKDEASRKRVELHLHSKMSAMDGVTSITDYVKRAASWGHMAIAITDHDNLQGYPEAAKIAKEKGIKMIYGFEGNLVDNKPLYTFKPTVVDLENATYVVFDIETSGFSSMLDNIIEIGAVKCKHGMVIDKLQTFVAINKPLEEATINLTGITDDMLKGQPSEDEVIERFREFIGDSILVAHNATFDIGFIKTAFYKRGYPLENPVIDTLNVARRIYPTMKRYNLKALCRHLKVNYDSESAHRADYDAEVTYQCFDSMLPTLINEYGIKSHDEFNKLIDHKEYQRVFPYHVTMLVKNQEGLKDLFKLVSRSLTETFTDTPRVLREDIDKYRANLLIGTACCNSEVFEIAQTKSLEELKECIRWYDYVEIQPLGNYSHLIDTEKISATRLKEVINLIIEAAKAEGKIIVATGDVHYLDEEDKLCRSIYIESKAIGGVHHPMYDFNNRIKEYPDQHFRTTDEMLELFSWLGEDFANEIVVENTNKIADMIEKVEPLKDKLYTPKMEGAEEELKRICYENAHAKYGEVLPEIVEARLKKELDSIIGNGFAVIYYIAYKLVKKSNDDGYIVGSRGSVGSSLVATMMGITEVNPLQAHYVCPSCCHSEFIDPKECASGFDLPEKNCPVCGMPMKGEGHNIPFETFLGFKGDKVPDIDLNFSGEYQANAHAFTKEIFGENNVFRAGTIETVAEKTAYGYVKAYYENRGIPLPRRAEVNRLAAKCQDVKRTTGQHPGGIIVIPNYMDVFDFTPVNYPADDLKAEWRTTHFDFHAIHDNVLKFDILGHVDPTVLKMLKDLTGIDPKDVKCNDPKVLALFAGPEVMGVTKDAVKNEIGTTGVPEFNTPFTKRLVMSTKPTKFSDLVQISGLSHGTDVWNGNAEELIKNGTCSINNCIGCRDDIMVYLMNKGLSSGDAFKIMEMVRKGKGLTPEYEEEMKKHSVPGWYIDSCKKIKYMFPKAHAVAYVMMALRSTWYKIYKPLEFYATYFSTRCDAYDIGTMIKGYNAIRRRFEELNELMDTNSKNHVETSKKDKDIWSTLENALEMTARGYKFGNIDIDKSDATKFVIDYENNCLIPPFTTIDGLGENVAKSVVKARKNGPFISKEDLFNRTQLNKSHRAALEELGVLKELDEANQMTLF